MKFTELTVDGFFSNKALLRLVNEYSDECQGDLVPKTSPNRKMYEVLEKNGVLHPFSVEIDDEVVGFLVVLITKLPHFSDVPIATVESLYLGKTHRKGFNGVQMIRKAKAIALDCGAKLVSFSAPANSSMEALCQKMFKRSGSTFIERLA